MEVYFSQQAAAFLWSVVLGGALGAVYDWFRIGRILWEKGGVSVFLEDLVFSLLAAVATAFCFTFTNYGQVRLFLLLGEGLGFLLYRNTLGVFVAWQARIFARFLRWCRRGTSRIGCFFAKKLKKFMNILKKPFIFSKERCKMFLYSMKRRKRRLEDQEHRQDE